MGSLSSGDKMASSDPELSQGLSLTRYSFSPLSLPASVSRFVPLFFFQCSGELTARPVSLSLRLLPRGNVQRICVMLSQAFLVSCSY